MMPGSNVNDPNFLVPNVVNLDFTHALHLPPRFSLPFQAIYIYFHEDFWHIYARESILEW